MITPRPALPPEGRIPVFWANVDRSAGPGGCWPWMAHIHRNGYGKFMVDRVPRMAHRVAFEIARGPIPAGKHLDHLCRTRACVNPAHLEPVSQAENNRRAESGHAAKTHCPAGHEYTGRNLVINTAGRRECRTCMNARTAAYRARQRAKARDGES